MIDIESRDVFKLQDSMALAKCTLSIPYVTVASNKASVAESLLSNVQTKLAKIRQAAVIGFFQLVRMM
jgi:hypothetical protein